MERVGEFLVTKAPRWAGCMYTPGDVVCRLGGRMGARTHVASCRTLMFSTQRLPRSRAFQMCFPEAFLFAVLPLLVCSVVLCSRVFVQLEDVMLVWADDRQERVTTVSKPGLLLLAVFCRLSSSSPLLPVVSS